MSGWSNPEHIELLRALWPQGLSCKRIAQTINAAFPDAAYTRNAVIGKVHRLGLSGRATPSKPARTVFKAPRPARPVSAPSLPRRLAEPAAHAMQPAPVRYVDEPPGAETVLTLGAHMCKWPIGDPALDGFTYCGRRTDAGSYCEEHTRAAYQPPNKRSSANDLARSLRRYL